MHSFPQSVILNARKNAKEEYRKTEIDGME